MRLKLVPSETNWDFFRLSRVTFGASIIAVIASIALFLLVGLNYGIDFLGGTTIRTESNQPVDVGLYREAIRPLELGDVAITEVFDPGFAPDQNVATVKIQAQDGDESVSAETVLRVEHALAMAVGSQTSLVPADMDFELLASAATEISPPAKVDDDGRLLIEAALTYDELQEIRTKIEKDADATDIKVVYDKMSFPSVESVGPKVSGELIRTAVIAVVLAISAVLFYIWLRFEWQFSLGAVAALVHDVILTIGIFSILGIQFDLAIIAALLTIVGYSLNDTVVVFDRVRENLIKFKKRPMQEVLNLSINETLSRTVMTSGTTLIALISLLILGGDVIRGFVFAMTWGVIVGTYSSVFVASNILLMLGTKRDWSKPDANQGNQFGKVDA